VTFAGLLANSSINILDCYSVYLLYTKIDAVVAELELSFSIKLAVNVPRGPNETS
jgi:hypothetical protein